MRKILLSILCILSFLTIIEGAEYHISNVNLNSNYMQHISHLHIYPELRNTIIIKNKVIKVSENPELISALYNAKKNGKLVDIYYSDEYARSGYNFITKIVEK